MKSSYNRIQLNRWPCQWIRPCRGTSSDGTEMMRNYIELIKIDSWDPCGIERVPVGGSELYLDLLLSSLSTFRNCSLDIINCINVIAANFCYCRASVLTFSFLNVLMGRRSRLAVLKDYHIAIVRVHDNNESKRRV